MKTSTKKALLCMPYVIAFLLSVWLYYPMNIPIGFKIMVMACSAMAAALSSLYIIWEDIKEFSAGRWIWFIFLSLPVVSLGSVIWLLLMGGCYCAIEVIRLIIKFMKSFQEKVRGNNELV